MKFIKLHALDRANHYGLNFIGIVMINTSQICSIRQSDLTIAKHVKDQLVNIKDSDLGPSRITLLDGAGAILVAESMDYIYDKIFGTEEITKFE